ncbi:hypothetical protein [Bailinhaonella thermotolerans]|uniref:Uncharacterized protein n=1 Tax=Bailinhaonella thermotolerans TaxID=1070861 RepID=A0A3A4ADX9_9ACTN|nr:hypothetical protein [Bailinhaonella thermotolerans]RJL26499.1 hypothetical protein D5H75_26305 [Bailinhaonella thermotolerans]
MANTRIGIATAVPLTALGVWGFLAHGGPDQSSTRTYVVQENVADVRMVRGDGDMRLVESARTGVKVTERLSWRLIKPVAKHSVEDGVLSLCADCPWWTRLGGLCQVDYDVEVPRGRGT